MRPNRWSEPQLDRRSYPRAEYRRTAPALLELMGYRCAVRDLAPGGLRVEPAPAGRVWEAGERLTGVLHLRAGGLVMIDGVIERIDRAGLALVPGSDAWPDPDSIDAERSALEQGELAALEAAWRDAEEIAAIADSLALPAGVEDGLRRLKGRDA